MKLTLLKSVVFTVVTVLATVMLGAVIVNGASGPQRSYTALFTDATSLNVGDDVREAGVKVGTVSAVELADDDRAKVTFSVAKTAPVPTGTTIHLRFRNLVGQRYVAVVPPASGGVGSGTDLPRGYTFTTRETEPALNLTLLFNGFHPLFRFLDAKDVNRLSGEIIAVFQGEGATVDDLLQSTASLTSTLADRDQVIGAIIDNLTKVMATIDTHAGQLTTTLTTLDTLVTGLAQDRATIGDTIGGLGDLTTSVAGLLDQGRAPLKADIGHLGTLSGNLSSGSDLDDFLGNLPTKLDTIGRTASYGSWLNFYVCSIHGKIPRPGGYYGGIGVNPIAKRCR